MHTTSYPRSPPPLEELADVLRPALEANYKTSTIDVSQCPDLRPAPFHLTTAGLSGNESIADIGGQPNLFPEPRLDCRWSLPAVAREMNLSPTGGQLLGAGAGPFHHVGINSELATNLGWENDFSNIQNESYYTKYENSTATCGKCPSTEFALMMNLYGSSGQPGPVLRITARGRKGSTASFTELLRQSLASHYGPTHAISIGGVFLLKSGTARFHIMPDFPPQPFKTGKEVQDWLTFHEFPGPIVCLTVFHTADPEGLDLRMEHTHCFSTGGANKGGHYHGDLESDEEVEYEAYLNVAKTLYRIDRPRVTKERD